MMKKNSFLKWLTDNKEWVFSGVGVLVLSIVFSVIINIAFFNSSSSPEKIEKTVDNSTKTTTNTFSGPANYAEIDTVEGDNVIGIKNVQEAPSYEDVTIVQGNKGAAIPVANKQEENNLNAAMDILKRMSQGEEVEPQEAFNKMFSSQIFINSGTKVSVISESSEGIGGVVKIKILEGSHKNKEGWVSVSLIKTEKRIVSKNN